jgi:pimeloyl-ACP methyl ester carboxylesterase
MRVLFIHGLESSPKGTKAQYLAREFEALTPAMNTGDFAGCMALQTEAIDSFQPDVLVGSSFGGLVAVQLLADRVWRGPTLLLAQASFRLDPDASLPVDVPVLLVHGTNDEVIPVEHSRTLATTGTPELVRLIEVDDTHRLLSLVESGRLADYVHKVFGMGPGSLDD